MIQEAPVRCHRCGTRKHDEDVGVFLAWRPFDSAIEYISWFHDSECKDLWMAKYMGKFEVVG